MVGEILNAVLQETKALSYVWDDGANPGTVLMKTDYKNSRIDSYAVPLIICDLADGSESGQYPGGLTRMDWMFAFNSYAYAPDGNVDDSTGYSTSLLNIPIDAIRRHFSNSKWLAIMPKDNPSDPDVYYMDYILDTYGFRFTLTGVSPADALTEDGLLMGYKIGFDSVSFDDFTLRVVPSTEVLDEVVQVDNPPFDETTGVVIQNDFNNLDIDVTNYPKG